MTTTNKTKITVESVIDVPVAKVWKYWNEPIHITQWAFASDEWHAPKANNDLRVGGRFLTTMAAKDGSVSFDFEGTYTAVKPNELIEYTMDDSRTVSISFESQGEKTKVVETFEAEELHTVELQRGGWQTILDNFKKHAESVK